MVGYYLAQLCVNACLLMTPRAIILSGGVLKRKILYSIVRKQVEKMINGYIQIEDLEKFIRPALLEDSGLVGAAIMRK